MQIPRIFNLGEFAVGEALYSNSPLSKQALSQILATSRPTIQRYEAIAYREVPDFRLDYPELLREQWKIRKASRDRTVAYLTVLSLIKSFLTASPRPQVSASHFERAIRGRGARHCALTKGID
ncbi:hypothetical protein WA1_24845 [Scytonema hofmannii PCC 7110]|uniref:Uncharacterized protein n=1 Tax=Scytonema hofmannii PCC 7110 TaxID=128403 RepID=A0A139X889_9CYAN|nr:hypothetical protein [Scytonema hofmannii]KYC40852.1 hypothetical protein WA1_24845 [Scytonema hofmannii PCC 7110]